MTALTIQVDGERFQTYGLTYDYDVGQWRLWVILGFRFRRTVDGRDVFDVDVTGATLEECVAAAAEKLREIMKAAP